MKMNKKYYYTALCALILLIMILPGCGNTGGGIDIDRTFINPGFWGTDGSTVAGPTVYNTVSGIVNYDGIAYNEAGAGDNAKSYIVAFVINSVIYIGVVYCADVTRDDSFMMKLYFTVSMLPDKLGDLGAINLQGGTHSPVIKIRTDGSKTFIGGTPTGSLQLKFSEGNDQVTTGDKMRVTIASTDVNITVPDGAAITQITFTDLIRTPY